MSQTYIKSYFSHEEKILVAVDCIIFGFDEGELKLLLMKKQIGSQIGKWSLIGSFVKENEDLDEGAKRVLKESTGLDDVFMDQLYCYGDVDRVFGDRVLSITYYALIRLSNHNLESVKEHGAEWVTFHDRPELIFDHNDMVERAIEKIRSKARNHAHGFELLPEKFTIPQVQHFFEEIYQEKFDKRNFRKKILSQGFLIKLDEKDKEGSKKGAFLYSFDKLKFKEFKNRKMIF